MKKNIKIEVVFGIIAALAFIIGGSAWVSNRKPRTVLQYTASFIGIGHPEADAASKVVFLGDSITAFEDWNVLFGVSYVFNAGFSGNTTDDVLARLDPVIAPKPSKIFLMIGINDLLRGKDVSYVEANYKVILDKIRGQSPNTTIYVQSMLPANNDILKSDTLDNRKIVALNGKLKSMADGKKIIFVDLYPSFCAPDDKMNAAYTSDGLHLNSRGYAIWKDLVFQYVK